MVSVLPSAVYRGWGTDNGCQATGHPTPGIGRARHILLRRDQLLGRQGARCTNMVRPYLPLLLEFVSPVSRRSILVRTSTGV